MHAYIYRSKHRYIHLNANIHTYMHIYVDGGLVDTVVSMGSD